MKTFKDKINEDVPINAVGGGNIAGIGIGKDAEPGIKKKNTYIDFKLKLKKDKK